MFFILACISAIIPVAGLFLTVLYFNQYHKSIQSAFLCGFSFSAAFYGYLADQGNDIYRHMDNLSLFYSVPIYGAFDLLKSQHISEVFTWDIWSWIIAQFGNFYLLQSSAALVGYSIIAYIVFDYSKVNKLSFYMWMPYLLIALLVFSPLDITVGIRNANAFILCGLAVYRYYIKNGTKYSMFFILLLALFLHHSIIIVILSWLILPFFIRYRWLSILIIFGCTLFFSNYQNYSEMFADNSSVILNLFTNTMYSAATYQSWSFNDSFHYIFSTVWRLWFSISLWICAKFQLQRSVIQGKRNDNLLNIENISLIILVFSLLLLAIIGNNGSRFLGLSSLLSMIVLMCQQMDFGIFKNGKICIWKIFIIIGSIINLLLYIYDMNWGTGSLYSFAISGLLGYTSRFMMGLN